MSDVRRRVLEALATIHPGEAWQIVENLDDEFYGPWQCRGWIKMVGDKKVAVILGHEGEHHERWRLFVNGNFIRVMNEILLQMGSGLDAQRIADAEAHRWN